MIFDALGYPRWEQSWHDNNLIKMIQFHKHVHGQPVQVLECSDDILVILRETEDNPMGVVAINKGQEIIKSACPPISLMFG